MTNKVKIYNPLTNPNAVDMLRKHFPDFYCFVDVSDICFFHKITESECGGDVVEVVPFAFAISNLEFGECALFVRNNGVLAYYGLFDITANAYEFLTDHFSCEVFWGTPTSTHNVVSHLGEPSPLDDDEDHICDYDGSSCEKPCDEWNSNGCWCGFTHFPENQLHLPTESVDN